MKIPILALLAYTCSVSASYFSAGWEPGQAASTTATPDPETTYVPSSNEASKPAEEASLVDNIAAPFYVSGLPTLSLPASYPLHIYAGQIPSDPNPPASAKDISSHLFFALVKARRTADKERLMFWFNGGPGCSSFDGFLMEVGPFRMNAMGGLEVVEGGWEEYTTMVYGKLPLYSCPSFILTTFAAVDQPAGTGYSYTPTNHYVHGLKEVC